MFFIFYFIYIHQVKDSFSAQKKPGDSESPVFKFAVTNSGPKPDYSFQDPIVS